jgi:hypothetical protein
MLDLAPPMTGEMSPAKGDLGGLPRPAVDGELTQPPLHSTGDSNRNLGQHAPEVANVELPVQDLETMQQPQVAGTSPFWFTRRGSRRRVGLNRKLQELPLRCPPQRSRNPGIQEPNHRLENAIGSEGVAPVDPKNPPAEAQHYCLIRVRHNALDILQAERLQPLWQTILKQEPLPTRPEGTRPAYPLTR